MLEECTYQLQLTREYRFHEQASRTHTLMKNCRTAQSRTNENGGWNYKKL